MDPWPPGEETRPPAQGRRRDPRPRGGDKTPSPREEARPPAQGRRRNPHPRGGGETPSPGEEARPPAQGRRRDPQPRGGGETPGPGEEARPPARIYLGVKFLQHALSLVLQLSDVLYRKTMVTVLPDPRLSVSFN